MSVVLLFSVALVLGGGCKMLSFAGSQTPMLSRPFPSPSEPLVAANGSEGEREGPLHQEPAKLSVLPLL